MEGDFFTIGQKNNNNGSSQEQYLNKFQSNNNGLQNPAENNNMQPAVDNALVDNKPGSFLF